jgi:hypothetical protein
LAGLSHPIFSEQPVVPLERPHRAIDFDIIICRACRKPMSPGVSRTPNPKALDRLPGDTDGQ